MNTQAGATEMNTSTRVEEAIRSAEISHSGMTYGEEKQGAVSEYARGWGDCLKAIKSASMASDECSHGVKFWYSCPDCAARAKADTAALIRGDHDDSRPVLECTCGYRGDPMCLKHARALAPASPHKESP